MIRHCLFLSLLVFVAFPASAAWRATTPAATEAVKKPRIASALEAAMRFDRAILSKDEAAFESLFADDAVVNNPFNRIATKQDVALD